MRRADVVVIGAGPAGMAAAVEAADCGLQVVLLDEQPSPGGQIYRNIEAVTQRKDRLFGRDYARGDQLVAALRRSDVTVVPETSVWSIEDKTVSFLSPEGGQEVLADRILLAMGALERPMPLPGWTLPGVMTAGAAQILLKQSAVATKGAVLVGSGPLLYQVAVQLLRAGHAPKALVETQTRGDLRTAMATHWRRTLRSWRYLQRGAELLNRLRNADVPRFVGARDLALLGRRRVEAVHFSCGGKIHELACDTVLLHHGVVPNVHAAAALGVPMRWSERQKAFVPEVDQWGRTSQDGIWIAGDGAGIGGAETAALSGRLAGMGIAQDMGAIPLAVRDQRAGPVLSAREADTGIRPFLERAYPPYAPALLPEDDVTVCRCEEVDARAIRDAAAQGCLGPQQTKAFTRAGMGRCQGRFCGNTVSQLLADAHGRDLNAVGYFRIRPPLKPVTLGQLAEMHDPEDALEQIAPHD